MSGDETIRRQATRAHPDGSRRLVELGRTEAFDLLASVGYGRVVFTQGALPAVRPVNHVVDRGIVIIRTRLTAKVAAVVDSTPTVVAYEADQLDPLRRLGWSVVVTGYAAPITDPTDVARLETALTPWVPMTMDTIIGITPEIITGFRLTEHQP